MRRLRVPRAGLVVACTLILAIPALAAIAFPYRETAGGLVLHHHTDNYPTNNNIDGDPQLRDRAGDARANWHDRLGDKNEARRGARGEGIRMPAQSTNAEIRLRAATLGDNEVAADWSSPYHASPPTVVTFNRTKTNNWTGAQKQGRTCNILGNILGLADGGSNRDDCMQDPGNRTIVKNISLDQIQDFYGPNLSASGSLWANRDESIDPSRSYKLTATGSGHAMQSVKIVLDGDDNNPVAVDDRPPCHEKCSRSATWEPAAGSLSGGEHTIRIVAENGFGQRDVEQFTISVSPETGILRQFTYEEQELRDRSRMRVNVGNGNAVLEENDVGISGTGLTLQVDRYWNSLTDRSTTFGNGWSMGTADGVEIQELPSGDLRFLGPSGYDVKFKHDGSCGTNCTSYSKPRGIDATLEKRTSGVAADKTYKLELSQSEEKYFFDQNGRFEEHSDKNDHTLDFIYNGSGQLQHINDSQDRNLDFAYYTASDSSDQDIIGKVKSITDVTGRTWSYAYDDRGNLVRYDDPLTPTNHPVLYTYDPADRLTSIEDPTGHFTRIAYVGSSRRVASVTRDAPPGGTGFTTGFAYNQTDSDCTDDPSDDGPDDDEATYVTDPIGHATPAPDDRRTVYCSDKNSQVNEVRDALGHRQEKSYSSAGNVEDFTSAEGLRYTFGYDGSDRLERATGPGGSLSTFEYQGSTFRTSESHTGSDENPDRVNYFFKYDTAGNMETVSDNDQHTNPLVELEYREDPPNAFQKGTLKSSTDGRGNKTLYEVDSKGNIIRETPPKSGSDQVLQGDTVYSYDQLARLKTITDPRGIKRELTYDPFDRATMVDYGDFNAALNSPRIEDSVCYAYDFNGNLRSKTDPCEVQGRSSNRDEYTYDEGRNLRVGDKLRAGREVVYTYDGASNLSTIEYKAGLNSLGTTTYTYNQVNMVKTIQEPGMSCPSQCFDFSYNSDNQPTDIQLPNGVTVANSYGETMDKKGTGRLTETKATQGSAVLNHLQYRWDLDLTGPQHEDATDLTNLRYQAKDLVRNITTDYDYDEFDRLERADESGSAPNLHDYAYTYDRAFNLTSETIDGSGATNYSYNNVNELTSRGAQSFVYDDAGNLCGEGSGEIANCSAAQSGQRYAYNNRNQTDQVTLSGGSTVPFDYAGESQSERISKGSLEYIDNVLGLGLEDPPGGGSNDVTLYTRNPDTGEVLGMRTPAGHRYLLNDGLGSPAALTDAAGAVVERYRYEPYGEAVGARSQDNPIGFQNQYLDSETGLYKMGARYYDPASQRWTQKDPMNLFQDPRQGNRNGFVGGDPVNRVDPSGMLFGIDIDIDIDLPDISFEDVYGAVVGCAGGALAAQKAFPAPIPTPVGLAGRGAVGAIGCVLGGAGLPLSDAVP